MGNDQLNISGLPYFNDVLLVDDINVNLINIIQLYDQELSVNFTRKECNVTAKQHM